MLHIIDASSTNENVAPASHLSSSDPRHAVTMSVVDDRVNAPAPVSAATLINNSVNVPNATDTAMSSSHTAAAALGIEFLPPTELRHLYARHLSHEVPANTVFPFLYCGRPGTPNSTCFCSEEEISRLYRRIVVSRSCVQNPMTPCPITPSCYHPCVYRIWSMCMRRMGQGFSCQARSETVRGFVILPLSLSTTR